MLPHCSGDANHAAQRSAYALERMRRGLLTAIPLLAAATLAAGCGSATKTVTVSSAPRPHTTSTSRTSSPSSTSTSSTTSSPSTTASTETTETTQTTTRTSTAPAFVTEEAVEPGASAAVQAVKRAGYTPAHPSEYHPSQTLQVLIATKTGSADGYEQHAFFFIDGKYIGTDTSKPSASIRVVSQKDTEVTLAYRLYSPSDSLCCPSGGEAKVTFQLDNGKLVPLQKIPPASSSTGLSRM